ncbi:hypothetical protein GYMLUDRAFT_245686 [Collybiopsis luxurians FD-317 M1]|uniref:Uncharacterized protein n=1 Tax=Collybiopsis luxurians FD-317 M1 TaxID=944289 RepID=A0A0D0C8V8_9AGAR|nr:hypothetical protein GYMLUDRAFT_245686 [Collybiopsis luxurians FD-317 M1]
MPSIFCRSESNLNSSLPQLLFLLQTLQGSFSILSFLLHRLPLAPTLLSSYPYLILGLNDLQHLFSLVSSHLDVETPFVFNSDALDLDAARVPPTSVEAVGVLGPPSAQRHTSYGRFRPSCRYHSSPTPPSSSVSSCGISAEVRAGPTASYPPTQTSSTASSTLTRPTSVQVESCRLIDKYVRSLSTRIALIQIDMHPRSLPPPSQLGETGISAHTPLPIFPTSSRYGQRAGAGGTVCTARLIAHSAKSSIKPVSFASALWSALFGLGPLEKAPSTPYTTWNGTMLAPFAPASLSFSTSSTSSYRPSYSFTLSTPARSTSAMSPYSYTNANHPLSTSPSSSSTVILFTGVYSKPPDSAHLHCHRRLDLMERAMKTRTEREVFDFEGWGCWSWFMDKSGQRLKRMEKPLPPFTWSTAPVLTLETIIDVAFLDVQVDLWGCMGEPSEGPRLRLVLLSFTADASSSDLLTKLEILDEWSCLGTLFCWLSVGGVLTAELDPNTNVSWMAFSRMISRDDGDFRDSGETARWNSELFKECNWVSVEFKALPKNSSPTISSHVPEYCAQLGHQLAGIHDPQSLSGLCLILLNLRLPPSSAVSTVSLVDTGWGKKESSRRRRVRRIKRGVEEGRREYLSGEYEDFDDGEYAYALPRNGWSGTLTPYSRQNYGDGATSSTTVGRTISRCLTLSTRGHHAQRDTATMDAHGCGMSDVDAGLTDDENKEDRKYNVHSRATATQDGLPEGAMPPRIPCSDGSHFQLQPQPPASAGHEHTNSETAAVAAPHQPSAKPKGPKAPTNRGRRHSKQNLVLVEYITVESEVRLTSGGETEESDLFKADGVAEGGEGGDVPSEGDEFIEEAARAARLAERERLSGDNVDDHTWVDMVVPSDKASQEVARVLNVVRGRRPYGLDDESDFKDGRHAPAKKLRGPDYFYDIEVQTVHRKSLVHPENEYHDLRPENGNRYLDYEEEPEDKPVIPKQRLGYFDLHPERRPASLEILKQPSLRIIMEMMMKILGHGMRTVQTTSTSTKKVSRDLDKLYAAKVQPPKERERDKSSRCTGTGRGRRRGGRSHFERAQTREQWTKSSGPKSELRLGGVIPDFAVSSQSCENPEQLYHHPLQGSGNTSLYLSTSHLSLLNSPVSVVVVTLSYSIYVDFILRSVGKWVGGQDEDMFKGLMFRNGVGVDADDAGKGPAEKHA